MKKSDRQIKEENYNTCIAQYILSETKKKENVAMARIGSAKLDNWMPENVQDIW